MTVLTRIRWWAQSRWRGSIVTYSCGFEFIDWVNCFVLWGPWLCLRERRVVWWRGILHGISFRGRRDCSKQQSQSDLWIKNGDVILQFETLRIVRVSCVELLNYETAGVLFPWPILKANQTFTEVSFQVSFPCLWCPSIQLKEPIKLFKVTVRSFESAMKQSQLNTDVSIWPTWNHRQEDWAF